MNNEIEREIKRLTRERTDIDIAIADFERIAAKYPSVTPSRSGNLIHMKLRRKSVESKVFVVPCAAPKRQRLSDRMVGNLRRSAGRSRF